MRRSAKRTLTLRREPVRFRSLTHIARRFFNVRERTEGSVGRWHSVANRDQEILVTLNMLALSRAGCVMKMEEQGMEKDQPPGRKPVIRGAMETGCAAWAPIIRPQADSSSAKASRPADPACTPDAAAQPAGTVSAPSGSKR